MDVLEATASGARRAVPAVLALAGAAVTASGVGLSLTASTSGAGRSPDLVDTLRFVLEFAVLVLVLAGVVLAIDLPPLGGTVGGLLLVSAVSLAVSVVRAVRGLIQESAGSANSQGGGRNVLEDKQDDPPVPATSRAPQGAPPRLAFCGEEKSFDGHRPAKWTRLLESGQSPCKFMWLHHGRHREA